jgi:hypothetical protein
MKSLRIDIDAESEDGIDVYKRGSIETYDFEGIDVPDQKVSAPIDYNACNVKELLVICKERNFTFNYNMSWDKSELITMLKYDDKKYNPNIKIDDAPVCDDDVIKRSIENECKYNNHPKLASFVEKRKQYLADHPPVSVSKYLHLDEDSEEEEEEEDHNEDEDNNDEYN